MGKRINLTEQEISSIRGLYPIANKEVLNEQTRLEKVKKSYGEPCNGNNQIKEPSMVVKIQYIENIPKRATFSLKAFFPSTKSGDEVYKESLLKMKEQIYADLRSNKIDDDYEISLIEIKSVVGSASNYLNGPLQPTHTNLGGRPMPSVRLEEEPYLSLPKEGNSKWNQNMNYAESRWKKMVSFITNNGDSIGFSIGKQFKEPTTIESRITDTGGCTDEERNVDVFEKPGQFVAIHGVVKLEKGVDTELTECASGLKIIVGFFKEAQEVDGIPMKKNKFKEGAGHSCDYATFTVYCNGVPVGIANMNNGEERLTGSNPKAMVGLEQPNVSHRAPQYGTKIVRKNGKNIEMPKGYGDTVYNVISVSDEKLQEISKKNKNGKIEMRIQGTPNTLLRPDRPGNPGGGYHGEAPMVCAYIIEERGGEIEKRIVYEPNEPFNTQGDVPPKDAKSIGSFDPCVTLGKI